MAFFVDFSQIKNVTIASNDTHSNEGMTATESLFRQPALRAAMFLGVLHCRPMASFCKWQASCHFPPLFQCTPHLCVLVRTEHGGAVRDGQELRQRAPHLLRGALKHASTPKAEQRVPWEDGFCTRDPEGDVASCVPWSVEHLYERKGNFWVDMAEQ